MPHDRSPRERRHAARPVGVGQMQVGPADSAGRNGYDKIRIARDWIGDIFNLQRPSRCIEYCRFHRPLIRLILIAPCCGGASVNSAYVGARAHGRRRSRYTRRLSPRRCIAAGQRATTTE